MRIAVVLMNLGGPSSLDDVKPFLFNLFYDYNIISLPNPLRYILAKIISNTREKKAKKIYSKIGNASPLLENTQEQAKALQDYLGDSYKIFIAMRYSKPFAQDIALEVEEYDPEKIIFLPLYPQFSTTTTLSSYEDALKHFKSFKTSLVCCYFNDERFINAHVSLIKQYFFEDDSVIIFSAHGLPKKVIDAGDPYQYEVEQTVLKIIEKLGDVDYVISYQSKVGPLEWIGPDTEQEIIRFAEQKKSIFVVPIAFVSEHSETLVELDMDYKDLSLGAKNYIRIPTLNTNPLFIECLGEIVKKSESIFTSGKSCELKYCRCINYDRKVL